jgi:hypothetical protein
VGEDEEKEEEEDEEKEEEGKIEETVLPKRKRVGYRCCPIPNCNAKPQKRLADHMRNCHRELTPRRRKKWLKVATSYRRNTIKQSLGQQ